jgi:hypothetical protein
MAILMERSTRVQAAGNKPKLIDESAFRCSHPGRCTATVPRWWEWESSERRTHNLSCIIGNNCIAGMSAVGSRGVKLPSGEPSDPFIDRERQRKYESASRGCGTAPGAPRTAA